MKKFGIVPKIVLWVLLALGIGAGVLFFVLGDSDAGLEVAGDTLAIPKFTDAFLYVTYFMFCLAVVVTLIAVIVNFIDKMKSNPKKALLSLIPLCLFVLVLLITWFAGSPEKVEIVGYDGTDNVGNWARMTDMVLYTTYIFFCATLLTIACGAVYTRLKK